MCSTRPRGPSNVDSTTDYNVLADRIQLENAIFTGRIGGALTAADFATNLTRLAGDATDRIINESDTGFLWFDRDGLGGVAGIKCAGLASGLAMTAAAFAVI